MYRQPKPVIPSADPAASHVYQGYGPDAAALGDVIRAWVVSGGETDFFLGDGPPVFNPAHDGVQLVTSHYVPFGFIGVIKQIRVAPFMPAILQDPWRAGDNLNWYSSASSDANYTPRPNGTNGLWRAPFGWEAYRDEVNAAKPRWHWSLRFIQGDIRPRQPVFDPLDPSTWYLTPDVAVPVSAYPSGIPGAVAGPEWGRQRVQALPESPLHSHLVVGEDTTIALFARWTQPAVVPYSVTWADGHVFTQYDSGTVPILPSFGQLHGYMQPTQSHSAEENATVGWGG